MSIFRHALDQIEKVDLLKEEATEILRKIISSKFKNLPLFGKEMLAEEPFVRSRYLKEKEDFHHNIQDYSYHPTPKEIKIGRANLPGQQIFYGARYRVTSLAEVRFLNSFRESHTVHYSLGLWEVKQPLFFGAIVTPEFIRSNDSNELLELATFIEETQAKLKNDKEIGDFLEVYKYFAKKFNEKIHKGEEHKYKITAIFSEFIFSALHFRNKLSDGILYQSVQYPQYFNVAIRKESIDRKKIQLTFASRQKYEKILVNGEQEYRETESIDAIKIDYKDNKVIWHC